MSQQVRSLETELAATLFHRNGPRISLTPAGERLYRLALPLVSGMDRLPDTFAEEHGGLLSSELRIACGQTASGFILPRFFKQFRDRYPGTRLHVMTGTNRQMIDWLRGYEVQFGVGVIDSFEPGFDFHPLFSSDLVLIVPLDWDHPPSRRESMGLKEASAYPQVVPTLGTYSRQYRDIIIRELGHAPGTHAPEAVVEVDGWGTIKRYVEAGLGISIVPELCLRERDRVRKIRVERPLPKREYGVIVRSGEPLSLTARRFIRIMDPGFSAGR